MGPVRMARSALLLLLCGLVLCWHANGQNDKFTYKFDLGGMVCTNLASGVICSNPPPYAMNTAGSSVSHRNIISFDTDGNYALGFEKATLGSWYLSIYKYNPSDQSSGASIWRAKTVDGVDVKANENSTLGFIESGNLELRNAQGSLLWTPGTNGLGVTEFEFNVQNELQSVAGNMILYDQKHRIVWQSMIVQGGNKFTLNMVKRPDLVCTNLPSGVQCTDPPAYPMNTATGSDSRRNVISLDSNGLYALGFEKTTGGFYLSIYKFNPSDNSAGRSIWTARTKSGENVKVDEKGTVSFLQKGSIELKDSKGKQLWTTGTKGFGVSNLEFNFDIGNMILLNDQKANVWQSRYN
ncbi:protein MpMBLa [Marchantia polymorpha subsp. ruderalis]|uniref:Bulb-type lectin domain-containing protein n=3 Tax=Marchantia polymorpha TaxID=3197 RepID=A0AAF6BC54_MARPO|nr:hypothetical protein MARPO_0101s0038 [Marchantia polymorpha]BBN09588.1 hypothetical protein Mp_4g20920 [Marchantia polymorpha subsp. ruderalis]|eukprot:PTQ32246.1 hypothetical protein MARPO_0101s0038 [Marchantia polymorpha]